MIPDIVFNGVVTVRLFDELVVAVSIALPIHPSNRIPCYNVRRAFNMQQKAASFFISPLANIESHPRKPLKLFS
jgi:hypothetical protein